jgi:predicted nucleotidyltransferase
MGASKNVKTFEDIRNIITSHMDELQSRYRVKTIGVFGSYARGRQKNKSDVDVLVEFRRTPDFIEFLRLEEHLSTLLGIKVDLVTKDALKPHIGKHILEEVVYL